MQSELLAGATIVLPTEINDILLLIEIVSRVMFGFFIVSLCMNFVFIFLSPIVLYSLWYSYHFVTFSFISALLSTTASIIATVMYTIFQRVITSQTELNIGASLGAQQFAFMWIGTAFSIAGWIIHFHLALVSRKVHHSGEKKHRIKHCLAGLVSWIRGRSSKRRGSLGLPQGPSREGEDGEK